MIFSKGVLPYPEFWVSTKQTIGGIGTLQFVVTLICITSPLTSFNSMRRLPSLSFIQFNSISRIEFVSPFTMCQKSNLQSRILLLMVAASLCG